MAQRGLFAGMTHQFPFPCPSVKQPRCVMLKPEAGRDVLLLQPPRFASVLGEGRGEGRGSECKHAACSLKLLPVALRLLQALYSFILI